MSDKTSVVLLSTDVQLYNVLLLNETFHALCSSSRLCTKNCGSWGGGWGLRVAGSSNYLPERVLQDLVWANGVSVFRGQGGIGFRSPVVPFGWVFIHLSIIIIITIFIITIIIIIIFAWTAERKPECGIGCSPDSSLFCLSPTARSVDGNQLLFRCYKFRLPACCSVHFQAGLC